MGNSPSTVVPAALTTGLKRDTAASTTASYRSRPLARFAFTSSNSTTTFLIIIPDRPMAPNNAMNPNGVPVSSSPLVIPIITKGMPRMQINIGRKPLNRATRMNNVITTAGTMPGADFRQLLLADHLFANQRLADFYGWEVPAGSDFHKVACDPAKHAGIVTHPNLMLGLAYHKSSWKRCRPRS
jgi:hypothetical protein